MIEYTWDERKAQRNERKHGLSFALAERTLLRGLGIVIAEQWHDDEWRTVIVAPLVGGVLITVVVAFYEGESDEYRTRRRKEAEDIEGEFEAHGRIISARKAETAEQIIYFEARPQNGL